MKRNNNNNKETSFVYFHFCRELFISFNGEDKKASSAEQVVLAHVCNCAK